MKELLRSPEVVNGGDKWEMNNDFVVEADEKPKAAIAAVTHRFLIALGSDSPGHNQCTSWIL